MRLNKDPVLIVIFILIASALYFFYSTDQKTVDAGEYRVIEVLDGDTVIIDDGRRSSVRYLGIDTPEMARQDSPGDPMAEEAKGYNEELVGEKQVKLEFDREKYDRYGRMLANVYVDGVFVNLELLRKGYARHLIIEPNRKYEDSIMSAVKEAMKNRRGIWGDLRALKEPPGNGEYEIDISKAGSYTDKRVVAEGVITDARSSEKVVVLSMGDLLDIAIFASDLANFEHFGITPDTHYMGKRVRVTGRVRMYRGTPGITVGHPITIKVVK
jgi:micrococcal nuclease